MSDRVEINIGLPASTPTPATAQKNRIEFTTDDGVHIVAIEKMTVLDEMDLSEALKVEHQSNQVWVTWATMAATIRSINGDVVAMPRSEAEIRAIITRAGDAAMRTLLGLYTARLQAAMNDIKDRAKN